MNVYFYECDVWHKNIHFIMLEDKMTCRDTKCFSLHFLSMISQTKQKKNRKKHTPKKAQEKPIFLTDVSILNTWTMIHFCITIGMIHRDSHWINSVIALIWIFISRWGGSSTYCELRGIWKHMKRIKSVCLHCQVTVVFRSVVTCYSGKPYLGLSLFNKTMFILHRFTKTRWQEEKNI